MSNQFLKFLFDHLKLDSQINFKKTNKNNNNHEIINFGNISIVEKIRLNEDILKKYPNMTNLDISFHFRIFKIDFLKNLKVLNISGNIQQIDNNILKNLDLYSLDVSYNHKITDLTFMKNLRKLNISGDTCGVGDAGIKGLDLIYINISNNPKIKDVKHLKNLKILIAKGELCELEGENINESNIKYLYIRNNTHIRKGLKKILDLDNPEIRTIDKNGHLVVKKRK